MSTDYSAFDVLLLRIKAWKPKSIKMMQLRVDTIALVKSIVSEWEKSHQNALNMQDERDALIAQLAECYRLSGADPDGNEDWRLAPRAVAEVKRLRSDYEEACQEAGFTPCTCSFSGGVTVYSRACPNLGHRSLAEVHP
jgi:hypothetical protein